MNPSDISEYIDFSKVKIHVRTPKERISLFCHKWRNCFAFSLFLIFSIVLIIIASKLGRTLKDEKQKRDKLPIEIERITDEISIYVAQNRELNTTIKSLNFENQGLSSIRNELSNRITKLKKDIDNETIFLEGSKREANEMDIQMKSLNESVEKNEPIYKQKSDEFLALKSKFISLGGNESDIPEIEDDMNINNSVILKNQDEIKNLEDFLGKKIGEACYKSSVFGFSTTDFHSMCKEAGPSITIIKNDDGDILGGYTEKNWNTAEVFMIDPSAFIFNLSSKKKFSVTKQINAVRGGSKNLVEFGYDFKVTKNGICYNNFPNAYGDSNSKSTDFSKSKISLVLAMETYKIQN